MNSRLLLQSILLMSTGGMLLWKVGTGVLPVYVHVRYTGLIATAGAILVGLGLVVGCLALMRPPQRHHHDDHDHDHAHGELGWRSPAILALLLPVLLGFAVPPRALGTAAIESKGFGTVAALPSRGASSSEALTSGLPDTTTWTMLDWVNALTYQPDNPRLQGQPIQLTGFVWRRESLAPDQFIVSRFVVTCCTADSLAVGLPVVWEGTSKLENDTWVQVSGTIGLEDVEGSPTAVILAETVDVVPQPANPYLAP